MATAEFLMKRIEGKKAELEKLEKKLARIVKAEKTNWEVNPYYYSEQDKKWVLKDIEDVEKALSKYEADLEVVNNKAASRNIQVIIDFLNKWKEESLAYYEEMLPKYVKARDEYYRIDNECIREKEDSWKLSVEERKAEWKRLNKIRNDAKERFKSAWSWIEPYVDRKLNSMGSGYTIVLNREKLEKDLTNEADRKYDFIIERTNEIVTKITDASNLHIGHSGELNGYIIGTTGTAKINTIGAGGYNIQRFHFRTLIHKIK